MNPVMTGMLVWLGVIVLLAAFAWWRHRFEQKHAERLEYRRRAPDTSLPNLAALEHDYEASLAASRERRGK